MNNMKRILLLVLMFTSLMLSAQKYVDIVRFQPTSLIVNSSLLEWEHREGNKAIIVAVGLPFNRKPVKDWFNAPDSKLHTYSVAFEYRHYYAKGFYGGVRIGCQSIDWESKLKYGKADGYIFTTNLTLQPGYELIMKRFVIDFYPVGIQLGMANGKLDGYANNSSESENMYNHVKRLGDKLPNNARVKISQDRTIINAETKVFPYPWLRSGISIGYKF